MQKIKKENFIEISLQQIANVDIYKVYRYKTFSGFSFLYIYITQVCCFSNWKLAKQSKQGPQRLTQLGYLTVHRLCMIYRGQTFELSITNVERFISMSTLGTFELEDRYLIRPFRIWLSLQGMTTKGYESRIKFIRRSAKYEINALSQDSQHNSSDLRILCILKNYNLQNSSNFSWNEGYSWHH